MSTQIKVYSVAGIVGLLVVFLFLSYFGRVFLTPDDPLLTAAKVQEEIRDTHFYAGAKRIAYVAFSVIGGLAVIMISSGLTTWLISVPFQDGEIRTRVSHKQASSLTRQSIEAKRIEAEVQRLAISDEAMIKRANAFTQMIKALRGEARSQYIDITPGTEPMKSLSPVIPSFRDLLDRGELGGDLVLGVDQRGELKRLPWKNVISCAFGGESGSGKTSTLRYMASQALLHGNIELHILDPHEGTEESLITSLGDLSHLPNVYTCTQFELTAKVENLLQRIEDRKTGKEGIQQRILILVDETQELVEGCPKAKELISQIGRVTRKYNIYGIFGTQSWPAKMLDGSEVRDNLTMKLAHRMEKRQARTLFDDKDLASQIAKLEPGKVIGRGRFLSGDEVLTVPYCDIADTFYVYQRAVARQVNGGNVEERSVNVEKPVAPTETDEDRVLLQRVNEYVNRPNHSLSQLAQQIDLNKGTLSKLVNDQRLSETAREKLQAFFHTANVIAFPDRRADQTEEDETI